MGVLSVQQVVFVQQVHRCGAGKVLLQSFDHMTTGWHNVYTENQEVAADCSDYEVAVC